MVDEGKAAFAKFRVKCRRCEAQFMVSNAQLLSPKVNPKGCRACVAKARRSKIEARGMTTPGEDAPDQQSRGSR